MSEQPIPPSPGQRVVPFRPPTTPVSAPPSGGHVSALIGRLLCRIRGHVWETSSTRTGRVFVCCRRCRLISFPLSHLAEFRRRWAAESAPRRAWR